MSAVSNASVVPRQRLRPRELVAIVAVLGCVIALFVVAYQSSGLGLGLIAALPLFVTWFSMRRYGLAQRTYQQTIQALSMLPEVAGLTPLGHGERTATYATALAHSLGVGGHTVEQVAAAARLHHIGYLSLHEADMRQVPADGETLARVGGEILRETGVLERVAGLVEEIQAAPPLLVGLPAAIVRVSSFLDDMLHERHWPVEDAVSLLTGFHFEGNDGRAARALADLCHAHPELFDEARASAEPLVGAADAHHCD